MCGLYHIVTASCGLTTASDHSLMTTTDALALAYLLLLSVAVIIVAIKSRNIRLARFKDTKKVNILIFLLCIVGICMFCFWKVFLESGFVTHPLIILYAGHMLMAFLCQCLYQRYGLQYK